MRRLFWKLKGRWLWNRCLCKRYGVSHCRFHYEKTVTAGWHNLPPSYIGKLP